MNWKDIAKKAASIGLPTLGTALAGGAGARVGAMIATAVGCDPTPEAVSQALTPENQLALATLEADKAVKLAALASADNVAQVQADSANLAVINATIQADIAGKSWLQQNAQAISKLWVVGLVTLIYFVLPILERPVPAIPESVWLMLGAILGITAWHQGNANERKIDNVGQSKP